MSRLLAVLPDIEFPYQHTEGLKAFGRFCEFFHPFAVVQAGRLLSKEPAPPVLDLAARWLRDLCLRLETCLILVAQHDQVAAIAATARTASVDVYTADDEYQLTNGWTVHASGGFDHGGSFPGAAAISLAQRTRSNVICGHTRMRGIVTETCESNAGTTELSGVEIGHMRLGAGHLGDLGFGVLTIDSDGHVSPRLVRVSQHGVFRYGGHCFRP